jgi:hypothetical protein
MPYLAILVIIVLGAICYGLYYLFNRSSKVDRVIKNFAEQDFNETTPEDVINSIKKDEKELKKKGKKAEHSIQEATKSKDVVDSYFKKSVDEKIQNDDQIIEDKLEGKGDSNGVE